ncbi:DUF2306 domain-containing protein [Pinibacter soli]|uniref:DUF2306 domain-containing protein n=1 Tax=Pinibacter soli TaxID=3044211 RepID=A0ABT6RJ46_9BACT|nr:DUF2306 domain-containing protein [Pinibacter soli]MDI3322584.1 DUF2306 domain-containing protein [Pinibacter soli]
MKTAVYTLKQFVIYFILCIGTFLMLKMISEHFTLKDDVGFLKQKRDYLHIKVWRAAFYIHVFSSIFTLMSGFTQFSNYVLQYHKSFHKIIGRIYAFDILFINFPAGMVMAYYANGHLPSKIAFTILDVLWFTFTLTALLAIQNGDINKHRNFMIRSYALTFSAITLRTWKIVFTHTIHIDPAHIYMIDAWMGFVPNLLFAEFLIWNRSSKRLLLSAK